MKQIKLFNIILLLISVLLLVACDNTSSKIEIILDGGGVSGNYNSSVSMIPSAANPNPYNTLEKLVDEWNSNQDEYYIKLNRNSMNGNRDAIIGYLSTQTGPDLIYQLGTTIAEDLGKDYFVPMTDYLNKPNKYVEGNKKWGDLYDEQEHEAQRAPDGNFYSIGIDRNVAGLAYNQKIFDEAGIDFELETYGDFIEALTMIQRYSEQNSLNIIPYLAIDEWYNIILEGNLYGSTMENIDVIRNNGILDSEEISRASSYGLYKIMDGNNVDNRFSTFLQLIQKLSDFYPPNMEGYTVINEFIRGNVAVISTLGRDIIKAERDQNRQNLFEMKVTGYPYLTNEDISKYTTFKNGEVSIDNRGVRRGVSGIGTGWWVTNSAVKKGTVEACVDFLQFVTAPQNNGRMVNDLGFTLPLDMVANGEGVNDLFRPLVEQYNTDIENDFFVWHVFNTSGVLNFNYWSKFVTEIKNLYNGQDIKTTAEKLNGVFLASVSDLIDENTSTGAWDSDRWGDY